MPRQYYIRLVIGSILFGVCTVGPSIVEDGALSMMNVGLMFLTTIIWGVGFHFLFSLFYNFLRKKNDDK